METSHRWRSLLLKLDANVPADNTLYVQSDTSPADQVVEDLVAAPNVFPKVLLVGARGGGKSSELRAIARSLQAQNIRTMEIDLDASAVSATSVSAFDLLYVSGLALLRLVPVAEAESLYQDLSLAYAGENGRQQELGNLTTALQGLSGFAGIAAQVAVGAGALTVGAAAAAVGAASIGLRLLTDKAGVVAETSPRGRALQKACATIAQRVRSEDQHPLCVLIDGLEKMNGEAGERFRQVFEQTRLLADTPWSAVITAPPCTLTETNAVDGRGFRTQPVWGFGRERTKLRRLIEIRFNDTALDPRTCVDEGLLEQIAEQSGELPRHAIQIARRAVLKVMSKQAATISLAHVQAGLQEVGEALGRGLHTEDLTTLQHVMKTGKLSGCDGAAKLFADGRILAYPPQAGSTLPQFLVHPLLQNDVKAFTPEA